MNKALQRVSSKLGEGKRPTYAELEAALLECLQERKAFEQATFDMEKWIFALIAAHGHRDDLQVQALLDGFMQNNPDLVQQIMGSVH